MSISSPIQCDKNSISYRLSDQKKVISIERTNRHSHLTRKIKKKTTGNNIGK